MTSPALSRLLRRAVGCRRGSWLCLKGETTLEVCPKSPTTCGSNEPKNQVAKREGAQASKQDAAHDLKDLHDRIECGMTVDVRGRGMTVQVRGRKIEDRRSWSRR